MHPGYHDLCLPVRLDGEDGPGVRARVAACSRLGYSTVALTTTLPAASLPRDAAAACAAVRLLAASCAPTQQQPGSSQLGAAPPQLSVTVLARLTVLMDDDGDVAAHAVALALAGVRAFDVVAVRPGSAAALEAACASPLVDLISLPLAERLPFRLRPQALRVAAARGAPLELCYAPALRGPSQRRQLMCGAAAMLRACGGGKRPGGVVLSSGAETASELRPPRDVANAARVAFGLAGGAAAAEGAARSAPAGAVRRAAARRRADAAETAAAGMAAAAAAAAGRPAPLQAQQQPAHLAGYAVELAPLGRPLPAAAAGEADDAWPDAALAAAPPLAAHPPGRPERADAAGAEEAFMRL